MSLIDKKMPSLKDKLYGEKKKVEAKVEKSNKPNKKK